MPYPRATRPNYRAAPSAPATPRPHHRRAFVSTRRRAGGLLRAELSLRLEPSPPPRLPRLSRPSPPPRETSSSVGGSRVMAVSVRPPPPDGAADVQFVGEEFGRPWFLVSPPAAAEEADSGEGGAVAAEEPHTGGGDGALRVTAKANFTFAGASGIGTAAAPTPPPPQSGSASRSTVCSGCSCQGEASHHSGGQTLVQEQLEAPSQGQDQTSAGPSQGVGQEQCGYAKVSAQGILSSHQSQTLNREQAQGAKVAASSQGQGSTGTGQTPVQEQSEDVTGSAESQGILRSHKSQTSDRELPEGFKVAASSQGQGSHVGQMPVQEHSADAKVSAPFQRIRDSHLSQTLLPDQSEVRKAYAPSQGQGSHRDQTLGQEQVSRLPFRGIFGSRLFQSLFQEGAKVTTSSQGQGPHAGQTVVQERRECPTVRRSQNFVYEHDKGLRFSIPSQGRGQENLFSHQGQRPVREQCEDYKDCVLSQSHGQGTLGLDLSQNLVHGQREDLKTSTPSQGREQRALGSHTGQTFAQERREDLKVSVPNQANHGQGTLASDLSRNDVHDHRKEFNFSIPSPGTIGPKLCLILVGENIPPPHHHQGTNVGQTFVQEQCGDIRTSAPPSQGHPERGTLGGLRQSQNLVQKQRPNCKSYAESQGQQGSLGSHPSETVVQSGDVKASILSQGQQQGTLGSRPNQNFEHNGGVKSYTITQGKDGTPGSHLSRTFVQSGVVKSYALSQDQQHRHLGSHSSQTFVQRENDKSSIQSQCQQQGSLGSPPSQTFVQQGQEKTSGAHRGRNDLIRQEQESLGDVDMISLQEPDEQSQRLRRIADILVNIATQELGNFPVQGRGNLQAQGQTDQPQAAETGAQGRRDLLRSIREHSYHILLHGTLPRDTGGVQSVGRNNTTTANFPGGDHKKENGDRLNGTHAYSVGSDCPGGGVVQLPGYKEAFQFQCSQGKVCIPDFPGVNGNPDTSMIRCDVFEIKGESCDGGSSSSQSQDEDSLLQAESDDHLAESDQVLLRAVVDDEDDKKPLAVPVDLRLLDNDALLQDAGPTADVLCGVLSQLEKEIVPPIIGPGADSGNIRRPEDQYGKCYEPSEVEAKYDEEVTSSDGSKYRAENVDVPDSRASTGRDADGRSDSLTDVTCGNFQAEDKLVIGEYDKMEDLESGGSSLPVGGGGGLSADSYNNLLIVYANSGDTDDVEVYDSKFQDDGSWKNDDKLHEVDSKIRDDEGGDGDSKGGVDLKFQSEVADGMSKDEVGDVEIPEGDSKFQNEDADGRSDSKFRGEDADLKSKYDDDSKFRGEAADVDTPEGVSKFRDGEGLSKDDGGEECPVAGATEDDCPAAGVAEEGRRDGDVAQDCCVTENKESDCESDHLPTYVYRDVKYHSEEGEPVDRRRRLSDYAPDSDDTSSDEEGPKPVESDVEVLSAGSSLESQDRPIDYRVPTVVEEINDDDDDLGTFRRARVIKTSAFRKNSRFVRLYDDGEESRPGTLQTRLPRAVKSSSSSRREDSPDKDQYAKISTKRRDDWPAGKQDESSNVRGQVQRPERLPDQAEGANNNIPRGGGQAGCAVPQGEVPAVRTSLRNLLRRRRNYNQDQQQQQQQGGDSSATTKRPRNK